MKKDKGTAGLNILLSIITMLFIIGLIVMVFVLMSGELATASYTSTSGSATNETLTTVTGSGESFANSGLRSVVCILDATKVYNSTGSVIGATNYTYTNCNLASTTGSPYNNTDWKVTYTYTYKADSQASKTANSTASAIANVTTWFPIIIVITAMVVLILLTVIIITAIRGSGMVATA